MRIGDLAHTTGVSVRSLRYYEQQELLTSDRTVGGHRFYEEGAADRVRLIQHLYAAGLSSQAIVALLPCESTKEVTADMLDVVRHQLARIELRIEQLTAARENLGTILGTMEAATRASKPEH
ncbi:MerR family transcriptional regulator [Mycolicibacterium baixiangningiae]|nr:MerR family transcriptional regulator [Mycolicibacterium baixiangningiae]